MQIKKAEHGGPVITMIFGVLELLDATVRITSFGLLRTSLMDDVVKYTLKSRGVTPQ